MTSSTALWIAFAAVLGLAVVSIWRGTLILVVLLPASEMMGLLDPMNLAVARAFDIHALVMIFIAVAILASGHRLGELASARFAAPILVIVALWAYGVIAPVIRGESTLWLALEGSKEAMMVFGYFGTFLFLRTAGHVKQAWWWVLTFGLCYCALELAAQLAGISLLGKLTYLHRHEVFSLWKVYLPFWSVVLVVTCYGFFAFVLKMRWGVPLLAAGLLGLALTFFRSYLLATVAALAVVVWLTRANTARAIAASGAVASLGAVGVLVLLAFGGSVDVARAGEAFVFSAIREITAGEGGALAGREVYGNVLEELVARRPLLGFGFINREADLVAGLGMPMFAGSVLGFVDRGSADVLVKFGYLGAALNYLAFAWIGWRAVVLARGAQSVSLRATAMSIAALIAIFVIVQPVHAPLTYSFALLPLSLVLGIVDRHALLTAARETRER